MFILPQMKAKDLCSHMKRCGVNIKPTLFLPRILFLSPHCYLDEDLRKRKELVTLGDMEMFLRSLREGYVTWVTDAITPSWISGQGSVTHLIEICIMRALLLGNWKM